MKVTADFKLQKLMLNKLIITLVSSSLFNFYAIELQAEDSEECQSLSGTYKFIGEQLEQNNDGLKNPLITNIAFGKTSYTGSGIEAVHIQQDSVSNTLFVEVLGGSLPNHPDWPRNFSQEFNCINGRVSFEEYNNSYADGTTNKAKLKTTMWKNSDQDLIVNSIAQIETTDIFIFKSNRLVNRTFIFQLIE